MSQQRVGQNSLEELAGLEVIDQHDLWKAERNHLLVRRGRDRDRYTFVGYAQ